MVWFILKHIFATFFDLINIRQLTNQEKDLEIIMLRQQLSILQRKLNHPIKPSRAEKLTLAVLAAKLKAVTQRPTSQLQDVIRIFQPETVLRWQSFPRTIGDRELVRRKWTYQRKNKGGRPPTDKELEDLPGRHRDSVLLRLARENPRWGYGKIHGELIKLGFHTSEPNVGNILKRNGIQPAPVRNGSIGWRQLMTHYKDQILACDFFTVETAWLQTIYVLFFIELGSRRVHFAGITTHPHQIWVTQQARQLVWDLADEGSSFRFLIHDNDSSFSKAFDAIFISEGYHVIHTPFRAPNANSFAERWIRSCREECLDHILIFSSAHLQRVIIEFVAYYNLSRPHQGLEQRIPMPPEHAIYEGSVQMKKVLGGIINDYFRAPTDTALAIS